MKSCLSLSVFLCLIVMGCDSTSVVPTKTDDVSVSKLKSHSAFELFSAGSNTAAKAGDVFEKVKVKGQRIPVDFFGLNEFDTYEVVSENGVVDGTWSVEVYDSVSGELEQDGEGVITCVAVESDGHTARLGGIVTGTTTHSEAIGTSAVWTVTDHGKAADKTTDIRAGVPDWVRDFHCSIGFPVEVFGGTYQTTTGDIEVEVEKEKD